jgi:two-component system, NtrC family, nitrogen regulation response regulator GlnG
MVTVVITENSEKIRELLEGLLKKHGGGAADVPLQAEAYGLIRDAAAADTQGSLRRAIVGLEEELYREKKGELYKALLEIIEKQIIEYVLGRVDGNQLKAARILGINRNTMRVKIRKLGIDLPAFRAGY